MQARFILRSSVMLIISVVLIAYFSKEAMKWIRLGKVYNKLKARQQLLAEKMKTMKAISVAGFKGGAFLRNIGAARVNVHLEKRHLVFLKVHKTGSSSVQNIFLRFGDSRNLTFVLSHDALGKAETNLPNVISYKNTLTNDNVLPPPPGRSFDLLCCHVIYNRTAFEHFLPKDTVYIGIVRDPISRLESAISYFNLLEEIPFSTFAADPIKYGRGPRSMMNNRMAFEYGFPVNLFPSTANDGSKVDQQEIANNVERTKADFDLILVNEQLDESLVLMKRLLGWHVKDIIYQKKLVANKSKLSRFSTEDREKVKSYLHLDYALYNMAREELENKIQAAGEEFLKEVSQFKSVIDKVTSFCEHRGHPNISFESTRWDTAFSVTLHDCNLYEKGEIPYIQELRKRLYGRLDL